MCNDNSQRDAGCLVSDIRTTLDVVRQKLDNASADRATAALVVIRDDIADLGEMAEQLAGQIVNMKQASVWASELLAKIEGEADNAMNTCENCGGCAVEDCECHPRHFDAVSGPCIAGAFVVTPFDCSKCSDKNCGAHPSNRTDESETGDTLDKCVICEGCAHIPGIRPYDPLADDACDGCGGTDAE